MIFSNLRYNFLLGNLGDSFYLFIIFSMHWVVPYFLNSRHVGSICLFLNAYKKIPSIFFFFVVLYVLR